MEREYDMPPLTTCLTPNQQQELERIIDALERDPNDLWNLWPYNRRAKEINVRDPFDWIKFAQSPNCHAVRVEATTLHSLKLTAEDDKGRVRVNCEFDVQYLTQQERFDLADFINKYPDRPAKTQERIRAYGTARSVLLRGLYKS